MHFLKLFPHKAAHASVFCLAALYTGCSSDVNVEIIDKPIENSANQTTAVQPQPQPANRSFATGAQDLRWRIPSGWRPSPPPRMVMARFTAPSQATLSISNFQGGGTDIANLTRWARQLGIAFDASQAESLRRPVSNNGLKIDRYYLASAAKAFDIAITRLHGTAWFFKMEGSVEAVESSRDGFESFLSSLIHFHGPSDATAPTTSVSPEPARTPTPAPINPSSNMKPLPGMEAQVAGIGEAKWTAPATWTEGPARAMRKATFLLSGSAGDAELSISAFPGDVGGLAANINRWRNQIGLSPLDETSLRQQSMDKDVGGYASHIVWLQGDSSTIMGAIVPRASDTWFFKATGPAATLEEHRQAFADFLESVTF